MSKNKEINKDELIKLNLTDKYDDDLSTYNTISWKDYALLYMVFGILVVFIIWASIATVDELTRGAGKIIPSSEIQIIQNLEGGIIEAFHVKEGDIVEKGQLLLNMSNIQASADYQANLQRSLTLKAALIRLKAVAEDAELTFPKDLPANISKLEQENYQANLQQQTTQLQILKRQLEQRSQEIQEIKERLFGADKILALSREEHAMIEPLAKRGTVSKIELLQLNSKIAAQEAERNNLKAVLTRTKSSKQEAEEKINSYKNTIKAEAQKEISDKTSELNGLTEALSAYKDRAERTEIRSPVHGTIKDIKVTTIGGVVQPGENILEIVPLNDLLIIEASVTPADIAFLYPEQEAIVKITAYKYEQYGGITATLKEISADTIVNERGESFYRIKLQSDETSLHYKGKELPIIPGMVVSVDILTGKKTIMNYLLSRFQRTINNALHER